MVKEESAGAIIFRQEGNKIFYLLLKAKFKSEYWEFPKGLIEKNENIEEAVKREVYEETGIKDMKIIKGFREKISYFYRKDGKDVYKEVTFFLIETNTKEVKISWEHIGYEWVVYEEALKRLRDRLRKLLEKAHQTVSMIKLLEKEKLTSFFERNDSRV